MGEVSLRYSACPCSGFKKSASVYKSVVILYKSIFRAAMESRIIDHNPTIYLTTKGGGVPQEIVRLDRWTGSAFWMLSEMPPYVFCHDWFVCGSLRRKKFLHCNGFSISGYRYSISDGKTGMAIPNITDRWFRMNENQGCGEKYPLPVCLAECLKAAAKLRLRICSFKPGWRTAVLYAV